MCFFLIVNCAIPNSAFLGPVYTGVKTGSVYQTSLSYSSSKIVHKIKSKDRINDSQIKKTFTKKNPIFPDIPYINKDPIILIAYKVNLVEISDVFEPEPLP